MNFNDFDFRKFRKAKKYLKKLSDKYKFSQVGGVEQKPFIPEEAKQPPVTPVEPTQPIQPVQPISSVPTTIKKLYPTLLKPWRKRGKGPILGYYFGISDVDPLSDVGKALEQVGYQYNAKFKTYSKKVDENNYSQIREELSEVQERTNAQFGEEGLEQINQVFNIDQIIEQTGADQATEVQVEAILESDQLDDTKKKLITDKFIREKIEELSNLTDEAAKTELVQKFLAMSKDFHNYSFINMLLMLIQNPNVSDCVAGKGQWENPNGKFKRKVKDGERPMEIFAPVQNSIYLGAAKDMVKKLTGMKDKFPFEITNKQSYDDLMKLVKLNLYQQQYLGFIIAIGNKSLDNIIARMQQDIDKPAHQFYKSIYFGIKQGKWKGVQVYDINQTESTGPDSYEKPETPDWLAQNVSDEQAEALVKAALDFSKKIKWKKGDEWQKGVSIDLEKELGERGGWSRGAQIAVNKMSIGWRQFATMIHEIAHSLLHFGSDSFQMTRQQMEIEAEAVSYIVLNFFDYNAPEFCGNYLALHKATKQDVLQRYASVDSAARKIVSGIQAAMAKKAGNWYNKIIFGGLLRGYYV
jgi:hypothetical protein